MSSYIVELSQDSYRFLEKLNTDIATRIKVRLKKLEVNPYPSDAKFIFRDGEDKVYRLVTFELCS